MKDSFLALVIAFGLAFGSAAFTDYPMPPWSAIHLYFLALIMLKVTK